MELITEKFKNLFKEFSLYSQKDKTDPLVIARLYQPWGKAVLYLLGYDEESKTAYCYVTNLIDDGVMNDEFGTISITKLEIERGPKGSLAQDFERDLHFIQRPLSEFKRPN